ncbi:MAG: adenylate/guanylate cyclase domain-containing protein [Actinomycetota bacterium]
MSPAKKRKPAQKKTSAKREAGRRRALAIRDAISSALFSDDKLMDEITEERTLETPLSDTPKLVRAVDAIEPLLADAVRKHPSFLGRLAYGTAQLVSTLASEDEASGRRLNEIAKGTHVGIVFIDVVGFTAFTSQHGDEAAVALVKELERLVGATCRRYQGEVVKHLGDGFLIAFGSASRAVRGALALSDAAREEREKNATFQPVRIVVHAGRPSIVGDDLIGHDVNLTARLLAYCPPGEVLVTDEVKTLTEKRSKSVAFSKRRRVAPRGVPDKVTTYIARRVEAAPS